MPEKAALSYALQTLGVWVVTRIVSAKDFSMKSVGLCCDTHGVCMFETVLSERYNVIDCFNVSHTRKRALLL